uniref:Golgi membrane protein 1 n=1 Tax=Monopterus albus TaxID=43700 RepID=A0A3Q3J8Z6_MONAL|nr:Golgi membrane protein 1 isoform X2 [Monopterus albus]
MGGLGNGRRGGRSPPLMIGALIACILVLGFNYWVSSSRNLDLQTKLYELEGQVRHGAAERGAAELKKHEFQEEIQSQKEQISHLESLYKRQLEGAQNTCSQEKVTMQKNISSSTKTIEELKGQLNRLNDELGKQQKELQSCQGNINTLNNKLAYDKTHCNSPEVPKKMEKLMPPQGASSHEHAMIEAAKEGGHVMTGADAVKTATVSSHTPSASQPKGNEPSELLTNEITVGKGPDALVDLPPAIDLSKVQSQSVPLSAEDKQDILQPPEGAVKTQEGEAEPIEPLKNNLTEEKDMQVIDAHEEETPTEDPGMEDMLIGQGKADDTPIGLKLDGYDADEQVVGEANFEKQQNKQDENIDKDMEAELADYNGDDENEGEYEADKQAELAQN